MTALAPFIRILGRGPGRARSLTEAEAEAAMRLILSGSAAPEAVGALLMLMRYRGETAGEIAGFVRALRTETAAWTGFAPSLDWPSYAAGRSRGLPLFLLSARLFADSGHSVLIHGWNSHQHASASVSGAVEGLAIPRATTPEAASRALAQHRIAYVDLADLAPRALALLRLRDVLGLRSAVNSALRLLNPAAAASSVQGVFHPPYRPLGRDAARLLGQPNLVVIKGGGGEFERHPAKAVALDGLASGVPFTTVAPPIVDEARRLADEDARPEDLTALWTGARRDPFATAVVTGTAALALFAARAVPDLAAAQARAAELWHRRSPVAA